MKCQPYPLLFHPIYKDYIWGGNRIPQLYGRAPQQGLCAESWEIADRAEGTSVARNGPLAGMTLGKLMTDAPDCIMGDSPSTGSHPRTFPLLIKIIDAKQRLSVQAHPDERTAGQYGDDAKTEMWYVLDAEPGARVFAGLMPGTDRGSFETALLNKRVENVLRSVPVTAGDAVYVPGGRIHAIGEGCLLLEVQQNSNTVYRVYDWDRLGKDGKPRELHIAQALRSINWLDSGNPRIEPRKLENRGPNIFWEIVDCPYFRVMRLDLSQRETIVNDGRVFHILFTVSGRVRLEGNGIIESIGPGTSCLMPAGLNSYTITPTNDSATLIHISPSAGNSKRQYP